MSIDVQLIKKIIDRDIRQVQSIPHLAELAKVNPETLRKVFARSEGLPLSHYVTRVRIRKAIDLLLNSTMACKDICFTVGFFREDVGAKAFKRHTGVTMQEFRKQIARPSRLAFPPRDEQGRTPAPSSAASQPPQEDSDNDTVGVLAHP